MPASRSRSGSKPRRRSTSTRRTSQSAPQTTPKRPVKRRTRAQQPLKTLKHHQKNIATFLSQYCPTQTGVILYHYMGTGKSFSSMTIAINWGLDIVLLAPEMLLPQWKRDYIDMFSTTRPKKVTMRSYEKIWALLDKHDLNTEKGQQWYAKQTLMMDECHNIADWMNNHIDVAKRGMYMKKLMAFGRRVLLTGTPMYWSPRDLAFQVNIAAGKSVMPVDAVAFEREYFRTDRFKAIAFGWVKPFHESLQWLIGMAQGYIMRTQGYAFQLGLVSTYIALKDGDTSSRAKWLNWANRNITPIQVAQQAVQRVGEGAYLGLLNQPLSWITRNVVQRSGMQDEYNQQMKLVEKFQGIQIDKNINTDAFDAFLNNQPINNSEIFIALNRLFVQMREAKAALAKKTTDSTTTSPYHPIPPKPSNYDDLSYKEKMDFHKNALLAIYQGTSAASKKNIDAAVNRVIKAAQGGIRDSAKPSGETEMSAALIHLRDAFQAEGGKEHINFYVGEFSSNTKRFIQVIIWELQYAFVTLMIGLLLWVSQRVYTDQNALRYIDTAHFEKQVSPYISYYKPRAASAANAPTFQQRWTRWLKTMLRSRKNHRPSGSKRARRAKSRRATNDRTFPEVIQEDVRVPYTAAQTDIYIKYTMGKMDYKDYAALQLIDSPTDSPELESFDQQSQENFERYGCYIGNICSFESSTSAHLHHKSHVVQKTPALWKLRQTSEWKEVSPKFEAVVQRIKQHGGRHCIYSNYGFTTRALCAYLVDAFGDSCVRLVDNDASSKSQHKIIKDWYENDADNTEPKVLLLDTKYTEGLSVLKTNVMHILDPCQSLAKDEQLKARAARLNSHVKGDKLYLYEYMCYCPVFQKSFSSVMKWLRLRSEYNYFSVPTNFSQKLTPEYVVKDRLKNMDKLTQELANKLQTTSVERYMPDEGQTEWTKKMPDRCGTEVRQCRVTTPGDVRGWENAKACHFGE